MCLWHCIIPVCPTCAYGTALFKYVPHVPMALHYSSMCHMCLWHCIIQMCATCPYGTALFQYVPHVPMALHYSNMCHMCLWHSTSLNAHLLDYTLTKWKLHHKQSERLCTWVVLPPKDRTYVFSNRNPKRWWDPVSLCQKKITCLLMGNYAAGAWIWVQSQQRFTSIIP